MRKERAMPQTVLLIRDDGAKARRVKDALFDSNDGFFNVEWVERCSEAVQRLHKDRKERIAAILVDPFLPDGHGLEPFDPIIPERSSNAEALSKEKECARATRDSIGDALRCAAADAGEIMPGASPGNCM
jgi:response regulator of citrate/malate metabolism